MRHAHFRRQLRRHLVVVTTMIATALCNAVAVAAERINLEQTPSGHLLLPVIIDGDGPFTFIVDTGATHTAIASSVAARLGFETARLHMDEVQALTTRFDAERFPLKDFQFAQQSPLTLLGIVIPVPTGEPIPVSGLLGANAIGASRYEIDFGAAALTLDVSPARYADGAVSPDGLLLSQGRARGTPTTINVIIDSGSGRTIVNRALAQRIANPSFVVRSHVLNGIDGRVRQSADPVTVRSFRLGGLCIASFGALRSDLDIFRHLGWEDQPSMVLGMDILRHARVRVDREAEVFEISTTRNSFACDRRH